MYSDQQIQSMSAEKFEELWADIASDPMVKRIVGPMKYSIRCEISSRNSAVALRIYRDSENRLGAERFGIWG